MKWGNECVSSVFLSISLNGYIFEHDWLFAAVPQPVNAHGVLMEFYLPRLILFNPSMSYPFLRGRSNLFRQVEPLDFSQCQYFIPSRPAEPSNATQISPQMQVLCLIKK